jgi:hypothetical protein
VNHINGSCELSPHEPTVAEKVTTLIGKPLDVAVRRVYQHISLVALLAWVGLGAMDFPARATARRKRSRTWVTIIGWRSSWRWRR